MNVKQLWPIVKETFSEWSQDKVPRLGAALAYYSVFSLAPLLLLSIGIAGLIFGEEAARGEILNQIETTVGPTAARAIEDILRNTHESGSGTLATVIGLVVLLFGASGVFVELQDSLNTIWQVAPKPGIGIMGTIRDRLVSISVVLGTGFLLLVSLVLSAALAALGKWMTPATLPGGAWLWSAVNSAVSLGVITVLFAMIFKLLPDATVAWRDVWIGAFVTAILFTLGKFAIGLYLGQSSVASAFGAAGSVVVLLVWVYYSSQILLLGAEFTRVYALRTGSHIEPKPQAVRVSDATRARQGMVRQDDLAAAAGGQRG
jgi:membrane protein